MRLQLSMKCRMQLHTVAMQPLELYSSSVMHSLFTLLCRLCVDCTPQPQAKLHKTAEVSP